MERTQLNIKIPVDLLSETKIAAKVRGKTVTKYIIDLVSEALLNEKKPVIASDIQYSEIESRLKMIESAIESISIRYEKPFDNAEAIRVSIFLKNIFSNKVIKQGFNTKKESWNDFIEFLPLDHKIDKFYMLRLKEILLMDDPDFFTEDELNDTSYSEGSLFVIVSMLAKWAGITNFPSLNHIRKHGDQIIPGFV